MASREENEARIKERAAQDAWEYVQQHGEPLDPSMSEWDWAAWRVCARQFGLDPDRERELWSVYQDALVEATERMC